MASHDCSIDCTLKTGLIIDVDVCFGCEQQTMADDNVCLRPGGMGGSTPKWMQGALGGRTNQAQQQSPDLDVKNK